MPRYNYWAFDVIGNLAYGSPLDMVRNARDVTLTAVDLNDAVANYGRGNIDIAGNSQLVFAIKEIPAVKMLTDQAESPPSLGVLPPWIRPLVLRLPWYSSGKQAGKDLAGIAVAAVAKHLTFPTDRPDILNQGKTKKADL